MKLINIYPIGNLCMEYSQDMHMFLTHLIEKNKLYAQVARDVPGYKILDNSVIELGEAVDIERILTAAAKIGANEIILPDAFQDGPKTLDMMEHSLEVLDRIYKGIDNCPYKLMAVAQGKDLHEWLECYSVISAREYIDVVGIPKVLAKMVPGGRPWVVNNYCHLDDDDHKPHHLLGLWYSLTELREYIYLYEIRSCDTVLTSYLAKHMLMPDGVRPDGYTVDLEKDTIPYYRYESIFAWIRENFENGEVQCQI